MTSKNHVVPRITVELDVYTAVSKYVSKVYALDKAKHSSEAEVLNILIPIIFPGIIKLMVRN